MVVFAGIITEVGSTKYEGSGAVLILDPDTDENCPLIGILTKTGLTPFRARGVEEALGMISSIQFEYAIIELRLPDGSGLDFIGHLALCQPCCKILVSSDYCDVRRAVIAVKRGAFDVLPKSVSKGMLVGLMLGLPVQQFTDNDWFQTPKAVKGEHIAKAYRAANHHVGRAARWLQMDRGSLQRYLKQNGLLNRSALTRVTETA